MVVPDKKADFSLRPELLAELSLTYLAGTPH